MSNRTKVPTLMAGVNREDIIALAPEYEAFCLAFEAKWTSKPVNFAPVGHYSGVTWFDQLETRGERYKKDSGKMATEWWLEKGYAISIAHDGALTIGLATPEIEFRGIGLSMYR